MAMLKTATVGTGPYTCAPLAIRNFRRMTGPELEALRLSLSVALRSVLASLPLAVAVAWLLTRRSFAGRMFLDPGTVTVLDWGRHPMIRLFNAHGRLDWESARWMAR